MNINGTILITLALALSAQAAGNITVCVNPGVAPTVLAAAEAMTSQMFAVAGVTLEWRQPSNTEACLRARPTQSVVLDFVTGTPAKQEPGALAYARTYEGVHIVVLYDRVQQCAHGSMPVSTLLAHVMTHEITHLLQEVAWHSATGVMKAHWNLRDYSEMAWRPLPFTQEDIDLIRCGLRRRAAGAAANSAELQQATR